jgi:hypothetical protein
VRATDAIVIDFCASRDGPLLIDPAALEVSLLVRTPYDADFDSEAWRDMALHLYSQEAMTRPPNNFDPTDKYAWLASCIRQVRLQALSMELESGQYATVLACYLYQAASKDSTVSDAEDFRRAFACLLAGRLLNFTWH